jgi:uncharacterized protein (TIGR03000 family)
MPRKEKAMRPFLYFALLGVSALALRAGDLSAAPAERRPATVQVTLPADATLTIDGHATRSTSAERLFVTPPLEPGKRYSYTFSARFVRDGKTVTVAQEVIIRAGRETFVSLDVPATTSGRTYVVGTGAYWYGAGEETSAYYGAPESPAPPRVRIYPVPREGRPYTPGFNPPYWGTDPSSPWSHGSEW